jgi:hypothetical protein
MLRKLFLLLTSLAAAAVGVFLWSKRDELKGEIERARGERRSGAEGKPRASEPVTAGAAGRPNGPVPASPPIEGAAPPAGSRAARVTPRDAESAPTSAAEEQCAATTQSGVRCTRPAEPGTRHCWQHEE